MTSPRAVLDQIVASISPASAAQALGARERIEARTAARAELGGLQTLCERLAAARHSPRPEVARKTLAIFAADHGVAHPGVDLGEDSPTLASLRYIASGEAAVCAAARTADAHVVLVDCGIRGGDEHDTGRGVLPLRVGDGTADITTGPAMSSENAVACLHTGIAFLVSLADRGLDLLALGHVSAGSEPVSGAVVAALTGMSPGDFDAQDAGAIAAALRVSQPDEGDALDVLSKVGGTDIGVMAGAILGAASINIPVVLDEHATSAAALLAERINPSVRGYLFASHAGSSPGHRRALEALDLEPLFDLGLSSGEGAGAALCLPIIGMAAALLHESA